MTREEARQWIPLLQAYADGAEIEGEIGKLSVGFAYTVLDFDNAKPSNFRIKPQDHCKCVKEFYDHPFVRAIAVKCRKQNGKCTLPDDCFCKDFREKSE